MHVRDSQAVIACTPGDPAGIGPDLLVMLAARQKLGSVVVLASRRVMVERASRLGIEIEFLDWPQRASMAGQLSVMNVDCDVEVEAGVPVPGYAQYVLQTLNVAIDGCVAGRFDAMVTGPVNKGLINEAGISFSGHTEYLAERTGSELPVMMLTTEGLRVALVTTHLPLRSVPDAITPSLVEHVLRIVDGEVCPGKSGRPRILVCGLNPHAGESGHMGGEEASVILPVIQKLEGEGMDVSGPYPADTVFTEKHICDSDVIVAMYHDQGLPVLKHKGFGKAVNITLGLPMVRTSVDHGTAYDLAGTGNISTGSMVAALDAAAAMIRTSR